LHATDARRELAAMSLILRRFCVHHARAAGVREVVDHV
jgi:hypothetical protein